MFLGVIFLAADAFAIVSSKTKETANEYFKLISKLKPNQAELATTKGAPRLSRTSIPVHSSDRTGPLGDRLPSRRVLPHVCIGEGR
jgi:hypothetical protein